MARDIGDPARLHADGERIVARTSVHFVEDLPIEPIVELPNTAVGGDTRPGSLPLGWRNRVMTVSETTIVSEELYVRES